MTEKKAIIAIWTAFAILVIALMTYSTITGNEAERECEMSHSVNYCVLKLDGGMQNGGNE